MNMEKFYNYIAETGDMLNDMSLTSYVINVLNNAPYADLFGLNAAYLTFDMQSECAKTIFKYLIEFLDEDPECNPLDDINFDDLCSHPLYEVKDNGSTALIMSCSKSDITNSSEMFPLLLQGLIKTINMPNVKYLHNSGLLTSTTAEYVEEIYLPSYDKMERFEDIMKHLCLPSLRISNDFQHLNSLYVANAADLALDIENRIRAGDLKLSPLGEQVLRALKTGIEKHKQRQCDAFSSTIVNNIPPIYKQIDNDHVILADDGHSRVIRNMRTGSVVLEHYDKTHKTEVIL